MRNSTRVQVLIVGMCLTTIFFWASSFPYPSPLIKPFLAPEKRWPGKQIVHWVDSGTFPTDFLEYFARDPDRTVPDGPGIVAPADGFVREMLNREDTAFLMIQLTFWDVHVVRTPIAGTVKSIEEEGITLFRRDPDDFMLLRGKVAPVQKIVTLDTDIGEVKVRLITNYWASRVKVWVAHGQYLEKGERIGRMLAGSTVVAEFPPFIEFAVVERQRVVGGETLVTANNGES